MLNKIKSMIIAAILIGLNLVWIPQASALSFQPSSLRGLAIMRGMAKESINYQEAINNQKPTVLEFYADWCNTCQGMSSIMNSLEQEYADKINLVMLNIDDPQWQKVIKQYQVTGVPQFTFLDANKQTIDTLIGRVPKQIMAQLFEQIS